MAESFPCARRRETAHIVSSIGTLATFLRGADPMTVHLALEDIEEALQKLRARALPKESQPMAIVDVPPSSDEEARFRAGLWGEGFARIAHDLNIAAWGEEEPNATQTTQD